MPLRKFLNKLRPLKNSFHGGLQIASNKEISTQQATTFAALPPQLCVSLRQANGSLNIATVNVGDKVLAGDVISVASDGGAVMQHAPTSGSVVAIEAQADIDPANLTSPTIVIAADGRDAHCAALPTLAPDSDRQLLLERIAHCGIAGMGGAGFPTARKLANKSNILIVNAVECEPYITCDDMQLRENANRVISGAQIAAQIVAAQRIIIGIEEDKPQAIQSLKQAITASNMPIEIHTLAVKYPSGNSRQLFELLLGVRVPANAHATDFGLICHNSATLKAVGDAVIDGRALIERYVTLSGTQLRKPQVFRARIGTPIEHLIELAGGVNGDACCVIGGPMMGHEQLDRRAGIKKTTNSILLLEPPPQRREQACIRCAQCAAACPMQLLPQQLYWYSRNQQYQRLEQYQLESCIECGICANVCPSAIPLVQYFRHSKGMLRQERQQAKAAETAKLRYEARNARLQREAAERAQKMAQKRAQLTPKAINKEITASNCDAAPQKDRQLAAIKAKAEQRRRERMANNADNSENN